MTKLIKFILVVVVLSIIFWLVFVRQEGSKTSLPATAIATFTATQALSPTPVESPPPLFGKEFAAVSGTVKFTGESPNVKTIDSSADPICVANNGGVPLKSESLVLGTEQTMANVLIYIKEGAPVDDGTPALPLPVILDQRGCHYTPHVVALRVGQSLKLLNSDRTLHNVHTQPQMNGEENIAMPKMVLEKTISFDKAEIGIVTKCDVHPWMQAYVHVLSHGYFQVTGTDGKFNIGRLPPGSYKIAAWHEKLGEQVFDVTLTGTETKTLDVTFARK